jgi:hypothetical protein
MLAMCRVRTGSPGWLVLGSPVSWEVYSVGEHSSRLEDFCRGRGVSAGERFGGWWATFVPGMCLRSVWSRGHLVGTAGEAGTMAGRVCVRLLLAGRGATVNLSEAVL